MHDKPVALVSGGNRGLGLQTCAALVAKAYQVLLATSPELETSGGFFRNRKQINW